jgi:hypothetical protein
MQLAEGKAQTGRGCCEKVLHEVHSKSVRLEALKVIAGVPSRVEHQRY